jgi:hypothetical protein
MLVVIPAAATVVLNRMQSKENDSWGRLASLKKPSEVIELVYGRAAS